nr:EF-hand domain pair, mitogen-activated protein (MAP) kinase [Tanacetum cinerariifolium]
MVELSSHHLTGSILVVRESKWLREDNDHVNDDGEGLGEDTVKFNDGAEGLRQDNVEFNDGAEGLRQDNVEFNDEELVDDDAEELVDEEHIIDQLDVNMKEIIDYDSFESDAGDDNINSDRRKVLKELKRNGKAAGDGNIVNFFFVSQEFPNREEDKVTKDKLTKDKETKAASVKGKGKKVITYEEEEKMNSLGMYIWLRERMISGW